MPFFINLLKEMDRDDGRLLWMVYDDILNGISTNPNLTQEQFLDVYSIVPHEKHNLMRNFASSHPQKENLMWIWDLAKKQDITEKSAWWVGWKLLEILDEDDDLRLEVVNYFNGLKDTMLLYNKETGEKIPYIEYEFFLEYMVENEKDLSKYDKYVELYQERKLKEGETYEDWVVINM